MFSPRPISMWNIKALRLTVFRSKKKHVHNFFTKRTLVTLPFDPLNSKSKGVMFPPNMSSL